MATNRQTDIHTHVRNAVTLVWGSLRLAPICLSRSPCGLKKLWTTPVYVHIAIATESHSASLFLATGLFHYKSLIGHIER